MMIASRMVVTGILFLLVVVVGGICLQIFLSRRRSRWPGLVLPVISFLVSLLYLFNLVDTGSVVQNILMALVTLLVSNLPTLVLLAIYWAGRERVRSQSELDKMNIQDL